MYPKRARRKRIAAHARILLLGIPALVVIVLLSIGTFIFREINDYYSRNMTQQLAHEAAADFLTSTVVNFVVAQHMSNSTVVARWLANEDDEALRAVAVDEIMGIVVIEPGAAPTIAVYESRNIYDLDAGFAAEDIVPTRQEHAPQYTQWFHDVRDAQLPYSLNVRRRSIYADECCIYVFAHHSVYYQGEFVGVITAGTPFEHVFEAVFGGYDKEIVRGYIIDGDGKVRIDSAELLELFEFGWPSPQEIPEAVDNPDLTAAVDAHFQARNADFFRTGEGFNEVILVREGFSYAAIAPIVGTDWSVLVLLNRADVFSFYFIAMIIGAFVIIAVAVSVGGVMVRRNVLMPLFKLTESIEKAASSDVPEHVEFFGLERDDEIGDLARAMELSRQSIKHHEELLSAANRAAEILLTSNNGEDSTSAIAKGLEIVGRSVDADRVLLFKNEIIDGELTSVMLDSWIRDEDERYKGFQAGLKSPYSNYPGWFEMFSKGESINCPVSMLPSESADFLSGLGVKSIATLPLFIGDEFFGRLSVGDCRRERTFSDMEMDILRSAGVMFVNAYHRIAQTAEIKAAIAKAEEANRAKTKFLSNMSHEMRTPMNSVSGIAEQQLQKDTHPPETEEAFMRIYNSSNMLLSIINDILDLSKVEAGKMEIIPAVYETASIITDTVQLNIMYIGSKRIDLEMSVDEQLPVHLIGDELRIKQILNNLLSNAFKYTVSGTVKLSLSIQDNTEGDDPVLAIVVSDTGQGMTEEQINDLFGDEFIRFNLRDNRAIEGSGLGMAITYRLIRMMGGEIFVESTPGKGSVFTVLLPQKKRGGAVLGPEAAARLQNLEYIRKTPKEINKIDREPMPYGRVLVVDDVGSNLYVAKGSLMPYKLEVETVTSGELAVEKIKDGEVYDIIFMDHMMPGIDGIEATNIIREMGYKHPIVALTANALSGASELFMENGFDAFISKPIDLNQLDKCLSRFIRDKQPPEVIERARKA